MRTGSGLEPTPRAEALIGPVRAAIEMVQRLTNRQQAFDPSVARRSFRICITDDSHVSLLPQLLRRVRKRAPACASKRCGSI